MKKAGSRNRWQDTRGRGFHPIMRAGFQEGRGGMGGEGRDGWRGTGWKEEDGVGEKGARGAFPPQERDRDS